MLKVLAALGHGPAHGFGRLVGKVLGGLGQDGLCLCLWELPAGHLELLIDQVGHHLRKRAGNTPLKELLLGRVPVPESDRKPQPLQLGEVAEDGALADLERFRQPGRPNARLGRGEGQDHQQPAQAGSLIHVAHASIGFPGLQFEPERPPEQFKQAFSPAGERV